MNSLGLKAAGVGAMTLSAWLTCQRNGDDQKSTSADTISVVERTLDRVAGDEIHDFHKFILSCLPSEVTPLCVYSLHCCNDFCS